MSSNVEPLWRSDPVAATVRAEMARKGLSGNRLAKITGRPQAYWSRRLTAVTEFSVSDLTTIARILEVHPEVFFAGWEWAPWESNPQPAGEESPLVTGAEIYEFPHIRSVK